MVVATAPLEDRDAHCFLLRKSTKRSQTELELHCCEEESSPTDVAIGLLTFGRPFCPRYGM